VTDLDFCLVETEVGDERHFNFLRAVHIGAVHNWRMRDIEDVLTSMFDLCVQKLAISGTRFTRRADLEL